MSKCFSCLSVLLLLFLGCQTIAQNRTEESIQTRFDTPEGYKRVVLKSNTFASYLRHLPLKEKGAPILDFTGQPIPNQNAHMGVIDVSVGSKDLQQCADAAIRLRAEYLWKEKEFDKINFHFTSGHLYKWNDHKKGMRPVVNGNKVSFVKKATFDDSYKNFKNYLNWVYIYAGSISVNKEMDKVTTNQEIKIGDLIVTPGSPGHVVIIVDQAKNDRGESIYLIAEGYTPAQSIHIIKNTNSPSLKGWYKINNNAETITERYPFYTTNVRRFKD
ncbi:DUF4846 domain-containing protein [Flammeovirga yaeyamensis]|uniref:DUF4846 domain-containing protein n=1 Tax=Flammeovirga yaeyamensis TaxID=367791 RepID=A0AAX1NAX1_9BACT|nr:DUF4846 domain-containing protein [Flammeovirga yaeyamensis]MBB3699986.1 hypothetical protein [Flammeovirga yaeyamensis]NMF37575.1 DUF4846 domain-containing protein [Flammeovirga yaeyamensis]QWG04632.1 DUF4846 domain-containing protein [Flammeovirga yaeyamensis]